MLVHHCSVILGLINIPPNLSNKLDKMETFKEAAIQISTL